METGRSRGLDAVRAAAALMVFANHLYWNGGIHNMGLLTPLGHAGSSGVAVFFVLSGYLIYRPFAATGRAPVAPYMVRRFFRIYPAYLLALVGVAVVFAKPDLWSHPAAYLTVMQGLTGDSAALVPSWTLTIEMLFYATVPLIGYVIARSTLRRQLLGLAILAVASVAGGLLVRVASVDEARALYLLKSYPLFFWAFVPGMAIAALEAHRPDFVARASRPWLPLAGIVLVGLGLVSGLNPWENPGVVLGSAGIIAWVVARRPTLPRVVALLAAVSYSFYLWQYDVVGALVRNGVSGIGLLVFGLTITAAVAELSYLVVERPAIGLGRQISTRLMRHSAGAPIQIGVVAEPVRLPGTSARNVVPPPIRQG